jgi:hypothetical protein
VGQHRSASGSILLGLDGFEVTAAKTIDDEWRLAVQTATTTVGCAACGSQARVHARRTVRVRDLPIGDRPVVLAWRKRIWRCGEPAGCSGSAAAPDADVLPASAAVERIRPGRTPISCVPTDHHDGNLPILKSPLEVQPRSAAR